MQPLNYRQRLFVEHYLGESSGSAVDAARRAGYRWPETQGPRLVKTSEVRAAIDARVETAAIPANEVLARIADVATSDLLNFIEVDNYGGFKVDLKLVKRLGLGHLIKRLR
ncbi:MAG: terminase small subunit, partial [Planctomycetaceae bacterium]|nr:terminase small subunit [Planctomycetaceae bacterium]